jgi:hypothetical protein
MNTVRRAESPTTGEWILAAAAALLGAIFIAGMVYFAVQANHYAQLLNWFGLAAAIMGAVIFELLKYAATTKRRHIDNLATRVAIVPEKIKELAAVTEQIEHSRQMQALVATFVELRARELMAEQTKTQLVARVTQVKNDLGDLAALEQALALDQQHAETNELAAEMLAMTESLDPTAKIDRWVRRATALPFVSPVVSGMIERLLQEALIQLSARRTRRARTRTAAM